MTLFTTSFASPLGTLQLQCTDAAVSAVVFAKEGAEIPNDEHPLLQTCGQQLTDYFAGRQREFSLPLAQTGTDFQQKVWELLQAIPFGKTLSYNELAKRYGDAKAIRAVAAANGKNNLAIIVPCHRVIGSNQTLTGYAGGLWRKRWLLAHEAKWFAGVRELGF